MRQRWTVSVIGVALVMFYFDVRPHPTTASIGVVVLAVALVGILGVVGVLAVRSARQARRDRRYVRSSPVVVDAMGGVEFERYIAAKMRARGFTVKTTTATGDFGVDLIAVRSGRRMAVQCKRSCRPVGIAAVQQVVSGAAYHGCATSMVVSNQSFTKAARLLAAQHQCRLWSDKGASVNVQPKWRLSY